VLIGKNEGKETRDPTNMVLITIKERGEASRFVFLVGGSEIQTG
jgi:hypothetical protein